MKARRDQCNRICARTQRCLNAFGHEVAATQRTTALLKHVIAPTRNSRVCPHWITAVGALRTRRCSTCTPWTKESQREFFGARGSNLRWFSREVLRENPVSTRSPAPPVMRNTNGCIHDQLRSCSVCVRGLLLLLWKHDPRPPPRRCIRPMYRLWHPQEVLCCVQHV